MLAAASRSWKTGIVDEAGRPRHRFGPLQRGNRKLRVRSPKPFVAQECIGNPPAVIQLSDQVLGRNDDAVEENLGKFVVTGDCGDRSYSDAGTAKIKQQKADAGVARLRLRICSHECEHPLGMMAPRRPDFLPLHDEMIAVERRARRKTGEVRAGTWLGITLSPDHRTVENRRQMTRLLRRTAEFHEDRTDVVEALDRQMRRADAGHLFGHDDLFVQRRTHAAVLFWPVRRDPALARQGTVPGQHLRGLRTCRAPTQRRRQISLQPRAYFGAKLSFGRRVVTKHDVSTRMKCLMMWWTRLRR